MPSSTTSHHKHPRCAHGLPGIRAGPSTSPRPLLLAQRRRGVLRQTGHGASSAVSFDVSSTSKPPSTASSSRPTLPPPISTMRRRLDEWHSQFNARRRNYFRYTDRHRGSKATVKTEVAGRYQLLAGDFFQTVPEGGDAYILKSILHDWNDHDAIAILRNCQHAMRADSTLVVIERLLPERVENSAAHREIVMIDLHMLVMLNGGRIKSRICCASCCCWPSLDRDDPHLLAIRCHGSVEGRRIVSDKYRACMMRRYLEILYFFGGIQDVRADPESC